VRAVGADAGTMSGNRRWEQRDPAEQTAGQRGKQSRKRM